jgi:hypothetical protein
LLEFRLFAEAIMKRYPPSASTDVGALITLCLCVVVAGGLAGTVIYVIGLWYRVLILVPFLLGIATGTAAELLIKRRRIHASVAAALIAFIGGAFGWGTEMGIGYIRARSAVAKQIAPLVERAGPIDHGATGQAVSFILVKWSHDDTVTEGQVLAVLTGQPASLSGTLAADVPAVPSLLEAAWAYLQLRSSAGTKVVSDEGDWAQAFLFAKTVNMVAGKTVVAYPKEERTLGKTGTWILWFFEIGLAGGLAAMLASDAAQKNRAL